MNLNLNLNLSQKAFQLIIKFEYISLLISFIGSLILYIHLKFYIDLVLYDIGISIFRGGLLAGICSFCFGVFFNGVQKNLIKWEKGEQ